MFRTMWHIREAERPGYRTGGRNGTRKDGVTNDRLNWCLADCWSISPKCLWKGNTWTVVRVSRPRWVCASWRLLCENSLWGKQKLRDMWRPWLPFKEGMMVVPDEWAPSLWRWDKRDGGAISPRWIHQTHCGLESEIPCCYLILKQLGEEHIGRKEKTDLHLSYCLYSQTEVLKEQYTFVSLRQMLRKMVRVEKSHFVS